MKTINELNSDNINNTMKTEIINNLDNPGQLEAIYRGNKSHFKKVFFNIYHEIDESTTAQVWKERLKFEHEEISWGTQRELIFVLIAAFIGGLIAKIPDFFSINPDYFYPRNIAFIVFPVLTAYFAWKQNLLNGKMIVASFVILLSVVYINLLPNNTHSDTLILASIHMPLLMWAILGFTFVGNKPDITQSRLEFLKYNGDLAVMSALILISGGLLSAVTLGLFDLIQINIEEFYFQNVVIWGLAAVPVFATYLVQTNPQLVNKVSPIIARIFTPLVLVMLVIYLTAILFTGKDPYNDREFLLIFNALLIGVMAIIFFSVAELSRSNNNTTGVVLLTGLAIVTIVVNCIALSAIIFRINEWGITPNRLAVLGGNVLILTNLLLVTFRLIKAVRQSNEIEKVENTIATYLPVYVIWTVIVTFIFPVLFNFK